MDRLALAGSRGATLFLWFHGLLFHDNYGTTLSRPGGRWLFPPGPNQANRWGLAMAAFNLPHLSQLFTDPMVRDAFARAERDQGEPAPAVIAPEPRRIDGAAVRVLELA